MKKRLTFVIAGAALAATLTFVAASSVKRAPAVEADGRPAQEVLNTVRAMGLDPAGEPVRDGQHYVLKAYNRRGIEMRVVADVQFGDIVSIAPARAPNAAYAPDIPRGPRIIHVPQPGDRASVDERDEPAVINDDEEIAPPPRHRVAPPRRTTPRWPSHSEAPPRSVEPPSQRRSDAPPPPPGPRRAIVSAPPPLAEGPSPIRPTPRFTSKTDSREKFGPPRDRVITPDSPPPGYTPPAALPHSD